MTTPGIPIIALLYWKTGLSTGLGHEARRRRQDGRDGCGPGECFRKFVEVAVEVRTIRSASLLEGEHLTLGGNTVTKHPIRNAKPIRVRQ